MWKKMRFRRFIPFIMIGFLIIPIFIALYGVSSSYNIPFTIPSQGNFELGSLTSFQANYSITPQDSGLDNPETRLAIDSNLS